MTPGIFGGPGEYARVQDGNCDAGCFLKVAVTSSESPPRPTPSSCAADNYPSTMNTPKQEVVLLNLR